MISLIIITLWFELDQGSCLIGCYLSSFRGYGVVSMCIGTGMGAAAVFEYPGP